MTRFANILETVGNTPVVKIRRLAPDGIDLYVKIEAFNPLGSVKDRLALGVIEDAEKRGALKPGQTVIEATSGNTGIGLAMVCAAKGYPLVVTMAESFSVERRKLMRFLGAKVVITPAPAGGTGMVQKANELAEANGWFLTRQFENEANADFHSRTTAKEIVADFAGQRLDYWVTGFGTGGTLKGVARVLAKERPETKIVLAEPADAPMVSSGAKQARNADGSPAARNPSWKPHPIQGWSPDFIPKLTGRRARRGQRRPSHHDRRRRGDEDEPGVGEERGNLRRHVVGRDVRGRAAGVSRGREGLDGAVHAAGHGRALPEHSIVRGRSGGHDGRREGDPAVDADVRAGPGGDAGGRVGLLSRLCSPGQCAIVGFPAISFSNRGFPLSGAKLGSIRR